MMKSAILKKFKIDQGGLEQPQKGSRGGAEDPRVSLGSPRTEDSALILEL